MTKFSSLKYIEAARETAATLMEDRGYYPATRHVEAALKAANSDDMESFFWSRVWDELQRLWRETNNGVPKGPHWFRTPPYNNEHDK